MDARLTMERYEPGFPAAAIRLPALEQREQILPFTVRAVTSAEQLGKAVAIRHRAYGRHVPALAEQLRRPEPLDMASGCTVLLAESKLDGEAIGTLRIQTNSYRPLSVESAVALPRRFAGCRLAEATRLGVQQGRVGYAVRTALFKAFYLYCVKARVEYMVIGGRAPLDRMYEALLFSDVLPAGTMVPLPYAGNIPHRIMSFEVETAEERWRAVGHPLYEFVFTTSHPDIDVGTADAEVLDAPRERLAAALAA